MKQQTYKSWDISFNWLRDKQTIHKLLRIGSKKLVDYFTKHHAPAHHKHMRPNYINKG